MGFSTYPPLESHVTRTFISQYTAMAHFEVLKTIMLISRYILRKKKERRE